ncbi:MAG: HAD family hydrolase [Rikenellaceae bacterium]
MNKAIFLDRDGTINVDFGYVSNVEDLELLDDVVEALRLFQAAEYQIIVITNQSGVGRGYFTLEDVEVFHNELASQLEDLDVNIDDFMVCPHSPDDYCSCRKPYPTMVLQAMERHNIDPSLSFMFGDKSSDVECGTSAGVKSYLITADKNLLYWAKKLL